MAWIEPITNWTAGNFYTWTDWNRVVNDADILSPLGDLEEYAVTENDFPTYLAWNTIRTALTERADAYGLEYTMPGNEMTADNFNFMELLLVIIKQHIDWLDRQANSKRYVGQDIYASHMGEYTDVSEEYVRD